MINLTAGAQVMSYLNEYFKMNETCYFNANTLFQLQNK